MEDHNSEPKEAIESVAYTKAARALVKIGAMEAAALLAVLARPGAEHKVLADDFKLNTKAISRATAKAVEEGILVGKAGAWVPLLSEEDATSAGESGDVRKRLADRLAKAEGVLLRFNGSKFRSALERDVAVALTGCGVPYEREVPYRTVMRTDREWTADFIAKFKGAVEPVRIIIEVTGRPDAQELLDEKIAAAQGAGVATMVVRDPREIYGLVKRLVDLAKAEPAPVEAATRDEPPDPMRPYVTRGGVYVDPRGIERRGAAARPVPPHEKPFANLPLPPPPEPIPGLDLRGWELDHLADLEKEEEWEFIRERAEAARVVARADLERMRKQESPEARVARARALLERDRLEMRARLGEKLAAPLRTRPGEVDQKVLADQEVEETGEECAERDELTDDLEGGRSE